MTIAGFHLSVGNSGDCTGTFPFETDRSVCSCLKVGMLDPKGGIVVQDKLGPYLPIKTQHERRNMAYTESPPTKTAFHAPSRAC
jgi:hypothetical protein